MTTRGPYAEMAAAGTTQAAAAPVLADKVVVTAVTTAAQGVILPPGNQDQVQIIVNGTSGLTAVPLFIYPQVGGKLNNQTANDAISLPPGSAARLEGVNALNWMAFF